MYEYKCFTVRVVDGNTVDAEIDLGFNVLVRQRIKLFGIDVPNIKSNDESEKSRATQARNRLTELLGKEFICQTIMNKRGKAGRILGHVYVIDANGQKLNINDMLIEEGFATKFGD